MPPLFKIMPPLFIKMPHCLKKCPHCLKKCPHCSYCKMWLQICPFYRDFSTVQVYTIYILFCTVHKKVTNEFPFYLDYPAIKGSKVSVCPRPLSSTLSIIFSWILNQNFFSTRLQLLLTFWTSGRLDLWLLPLGRKRERVAKILADFLPTPKNVLFI